MYGAIVWDQRGGNTGPHVNGRASSSSMQEQACTTWSISDNMTGRIWAEAWADWDFKKALAYVKVDGKQVTSDKIRARSPAKQTSSSIEADFGGELGWLRVRAVWMGIVSKSDNKGAVESAPCYRSLSKKKKAV